MTLKSKYYIWLITFMLCTLHLTAQTTTSRQSSHLSVAPAESMGMSSERLERIDNMLKQSLVDNTIPGAVALIARNGKIVFHEAYGNADANGKN